MTQVSLVYTGGQLGVTSGQIHLSKLREDGYTRDFSTFGYLRVNPFKVEDGEADDPARADDKHYLGNWVNYLQNQLPTGAGLIPTESYGEVPIDWTAQAGYSRAPSILRHVMYIKDTGETEYNTAALDTDPFTAPDATLDAGDGTSYTAPGSLYIGNVVAVGLKIEFDDSVTLHLSPAFNPDGSWSWPLTGATGVAVKVYDTHPTITSVTQSPDPDSCAIGDSVDITISYDSDGDSHMTLQESIDGAAFIDVDTNIPDGTTSATISRSSGYNYNFRMKYNDLSPSDWSTEADIDAQCNNL